MHVYEPVNVLSISRVVSIVQCELKQRPYVLEYLLGESRMFACSCGPQNTYIDRFPTNRWQTLAQIKTK